MNASETNKPKRNILGRFFAFLGVTLLCLIVTLLGMIWVLERGPSPTVSAMFTRSVRETSAIRWISNLFLTDEELEQYKSASTEDITTESINTSLIHIEQVAEKVQTPEESVQLIDIAEGTCKGKLLIVSNPKQVILGVWLLENKETPKFAKKVEDAGFYNNWNGLTVKQALKKEVDAVSGATYTSNGVIKSVQAALKAL